MNALIKLFLTLKQWKKLIDNNLVLGYNTITESQSSERKRNPLIGTTSE